MSLHVGVRRGPVAAKTERLAAELVTMEELASKKFSNYTIQIT